MIKRAFDIIASFSMLVVLSPVMIVIALIIVLESPGAPIYSARRVGRNWKKFNFYKFRSMRKASDKELSKLAGRNSYLDVVVDTESIHLPMQMTDIFLYGDNYKVNEYDFLAENAKRLNTSFIKVENDPRITKFGHILRKTSLDELPQLFNILKGDMSFVGNRPLSDAEAELLTTDLYAPRFYCPAGLTGLWQTQKDKDRMAPEKRRMLDVEYAKRQSLWFDAKILISTVRQVLTKNNG